MADYVVTLQTSASNAVQNLISMEYQALTARAELAALHQSRIDYHSDLMHKRDAISAEIYKCLQDLSGYDPSKSFKA